MTHRLTSSIKHISDLLLQRRLGFVELSDLAQESLNIMSQMTDPMVVRQIAKDLQMIAPYQREMAKEPSLEEMVVEIDQELGQEMGGFSRLLSSILESYAVKKDPSFELSSLSAHERKIFVPFQKGLEQIEAMLEICEAFDIACHHVPTCIFLWVLAAIMNCREEEDPSLGYMLWAQWLKHRQCKPILYKLFSSAAFIEDVEGLLKTGADEPSLLSPLALWYLSRRMTAQAEMLPSESKQVEKLLNMAQLGSLDIFLKAGFFQKGAQIIAL